MNALNLQQAVQTLWHIHVRLARLVAIAFLWLIVLTAIALAGLGWAMWAHWNTLVQMTAAVPSWLLGSVSTGAVVAMVAVVYRAYHWLAKRFLSQYLFHGLGD
jgi:hypothetical protein